jgi:hypothetical protein
MDGYFHLKSNIQLQAEMMILASPLASNETDLQFYITGQSSPSKFIHTLPNIRASALCEYLKWKGPLLCIQNDPITLVQGLIESFLFSKNGEKTVLTLSVEKTNSHNYRSHYFFFSHKCMNLQTNNMLTLEYNLENQVEHTNENVSDLKLFKWLENLNNHSKNSFCNLGTNWYIMKP